METEAETHVTDHHRDYLYQMDQYILVWEKTLAGKKDNNRTSRCEGEGIILSRTSRNTAARQTLTHLNLGRLQYAWKRLNGHQSESP